MKEAQAALEKVIKQREKLRQLADELASTLARFHTLKKRYAEQSAQALLSGEPPPEAPEELHDLERQINDTTTTLDAARAIVAHQTRVAVEAARKALNERVTALRLLAGKKHGNVIDTVRAALNRLAELIGANATRSLIAPHPLASEILAGLPEVQGLVGMADHLDYASKWDEGTQEPWDQLRRLSEVDTDPADKALSNE